MMSTMNQLYQYSEYSPIIKNEIIVNNAIELSVNKVSYSLMRYTFKIAVFAATGGVVWQQIFPAVIS